MASRQARAALRRQDSHLPGAGIRGRLPTAAGASAHEAGIYAVAFSADGTRLATAARDKTAKVWDAGTLDPLVRLDRAAGGHTHSVNALLWLGDTLVTCGDDKRIVAWKCSSSEKMLPIPAALPFRPHRRHALAQRPDLRCVRVPVPGGVPSVRPHRLAGERVAPGPRLAATTTLVMLLLNVVMPVLMPRVVRRGAMDRGPGDRVGAGEPGVDRSGQPGVQPPGRHRWARLVGPARFEDYTLLVGIFPVSLGVLWNEYRLARRYQSSSAAMNTGMGPTNTQPRAPCAWSSQRDRPGGPGTGPGRPLVPALGRELRGGAPPGAGPASAHRVAVQPETGRGGACRTPFAAPLPQTPPGEPGPGEACEQECPGYHLFLEAEVDPCRCRAA